MEYLSLVDIFPTNINFNFQSKSNYKNKLGGAMMILATVIICLLSINIIFDFIYMRTPTTIYQVEKSNFDYLNLTNLTYSLSLRVESPAYPPNGKNRNITKFESKLKLNAYYINNNKKTNLSIQKTYLDDFNLKFDFGLTSDTLLNKLYNYIEFEIYIDQNLTSSSEVFKLAFNSNDSTVNLTDVENPVETARDYRYVEIKKDSHFLMDMFLGKTIVYTDDSWFLKSDNSNYKNVSQIRVEDYNSQFVSIIDSEPQVKGRIKFSNRRETYIRHYPKITDVLPKINTLINMTLLFFSFVTAYFKQITLNADLFNSIFNFKDFNQEVHNQNLTLKQPPEKRKTQTIDRTEGASGLKIRKNSLENASNTMNREFIEKRAQQNYFGTRDALKIGLNCICSKNFDIKKKKFKQAMKIKNKLLNVDFYFLNLMELQFLKHLVVDDDQLKVFNLVGAPYVRGEGEREAEINRLSYMVNNIEKFTMNNFKHSHFQNLDESLVSLSNLKLKMEKSNLDTKLLNHVKTYYSIDESTIN